MMPSLLTIDQRAITLSAADQSKIYGDALSLGSSAFSKTVGTYANSELATSVSLTSTNSTIPVQPKVLDLKRQISISSATGTGGFLESNYILYTSADLHITTTIELTAGDQTKIYGDSLILKF